MRALCALCAFVGCFYNGQDAEKKKLALMFQMKGGKALPEELTLAPIEGMATIGPICTPWPASICAALFPS